MNEDSEIPKTECLCELLIKRLQDTRHEQDCLDRLALRLTRLISLEEQYRGMSDRMLLDVVEHDLLGDMGLMSRKAAIMEELISRFRVYADLPQSQAFDTGDAEDEPV